MEPFIVYRYIRYHRLGIFHYLRVQEIHCIQLWDISSHCQGRDKIKMERYVGFHCT